MKVCILIKSPMKLFTFFIDILKLKYFPMLYV